MLLGDKRIAHNQGVRNMEYWVNRSNRRTLHKGNCIYVEDNALLYPKNWRRLSDQEAKRALRDKQTYKCEICL